MFCKTNKCKHYGSAIKYSRSCYYEPQCWKGYLDIMIITIKDTIKIRLIK